LSPPFTYRSEQVADLLVCLFSLFPSRPTENGVAGACGTVHSDSDYIVALQTSVYANGAHCGSQISATANGKTITLTVADECPTCVSSGSIDLSEGAFLALSSLDAGVAEVSWSFIN
jgi:expansin (peptidoglycan-binding protein)